jgi:fluoride ion exporter CrcB/FEX
LQQEEQQLQLAQKPVAPLALYPPHPRDEDEARESFRRGAIDKAHEVSALSWPEHVQNHDAQRFQDAVKRRLVTEQPSILSETLSTDVDGRILRTDLSFHSLSARSTLEKKRQKSYEDLRVIASTDAISPLSTRPNSPVTTPRPLSPRLILGDGLSIQNDDTEVENGDIEIIAAMPNLMVEGEAKESKPKSKLAAAMKKVKLRKKPKIEGLAMWEKIYDRHIQLMVSLALFSYLGQFTRYFLGQLFGMACHVPNSVDWDSSWRVCTSSPGTTDSIGGAFFTDLPANIIGCFLMGLLLSGSGESLSVNIPMAILPRNHFFQNWVVSHTGMRTGFCGSLTTFASWNTQMVVMLCGSNRATALGYSQWMSALWGYVVGFYASIQSFQFGAAVSSAISRWRNPHLAKEADRIVDKKAIGVVIHRELPDFERRFLHAIVLEKQYKDETNKYGGENLLKYGENSYKSYYDDHIHHLQGWKETTDDHRNGRLGIFDDFSNNYISELHEIEKNLLVQRIEPRQELLEIARDAGWDVMALRDWTSTVILEDHAAEVAKREGKKSSSTKEKNIDSSESDTDTHIEDSNFVKSFSSVAEVSITLFCFLLVTVLLVTGFIYYNNRAEESTVDITDPTRIDPVIAANYRAQFLSSLMAPLGTYLRWYLSRLNGSIRSKNWEWLPIGTLMANLFASSVSAMCAAILLSFDSQSLEGAFFKAFQSGFAGCCSTVSTFASETTGLLRALPRAFWGYYYGFGSMASALLIAVLSYVWAVI